MGNDPITTSHAQSELTKIGSSQSIRAITTKNGISQIHPMDSPALSQAVNKMTNQAAETPSD